MTTINSSTPTPTTTAITKSPELEEERETPPPPPKIQYHHPIKPTTLFSNGLLKRSTPSLSTSSTIQYKECLKNHAASLGGHALDGCGEFMPAPTATPSDPTSLKCAACGCHRNFHRRDPDNAPPPSTPVPLIEYHPHHRHHPLPPPPRRENSGGGSQSPPPISSSYAPHMLLALSHATNTNPDSDRAHHLRPSTDPGSNPTRKRFRTKFSQEQKDKMFEFAEKVGWKMQKSNEDLVNGFCSDVGVERGVFKVWMHNNKNTFGKRSGGATSGGSTVDLGVTNGNGSSGEINHHRDYHDHQDQEHQLFGGHHQPHHQYNGKSHESNNNAHTNCSSSSS